MKCCCPSQFLQSAHDEHHIGCRVLGPEAGLFLGKNPSFLTKVAKSMGRDFEENIASMRHQREALVVATLGLILLLV